jgi:hypothetical protein
VLEFINDKKEIDNILLQIEKEVKNSSKILGSMIIDDCEIFNDYYNYFLDNIRSIEKVVVKSLTYKELVNETLSTTLDYLKRTTILIEGLANNFYKSPDRKAWNDLNDLLEGISWIISTFSSIDNDLNLKDIINNYENWNLYSKDVISLSNVLPNFEEALSNQDNVTIADILSYEIQPLFIQMSEKLSKIVSTEESNHDLN